MLNKRVVIAGEPPFIDHFYTLCVAQGYKTDLYNVDDLEDSEILAEMVRDATRCDIFIESLNESPAMKLWLIEGVEVNLKEKTPILTHTLCTTATEVASWCKHPQRVVGYGFLLPNTGLMEFAPALQADFNGIVPAREFIEKLGFEIVRVPDTPAMVRARIVCCLINEAIFALDQQLATAEMIDQSPVLGMNFPKGMLGWADELGLDVVLGTLNALYDFWKEERYRPAPLLKQKVLAGQLGKKVGQGFFSYES